SLFTLGTLIGLLVRFDAQLIFDDRSVTLNVIVATLSTANRAGVTYAIGFALGQWKWISFSQEEPRRLQDFERLDLASRGPLGGTILLFNNHVKGLYVAKVGGLLTILGIAMNPFAQQLLQYRQSVEFSIEGLGPGAFVTRAQRYSKGDEVRVQARGITYEDLPNATSGPFGPAVMSCPDFSIKSAINYGLAQPLEAVSQQTSYACSTANCTYPDFTSLSVCNSCKDLSSQISHRQADVGNRLSFTLDRSNFGVFVDPTIKFVLEYHLPNGLYIDNSVNLAMLGTAHPSHTVSHKHINTLIWSQLVLRHRGPDPRSLKLDFPSPLVEATECALYYCVKRYTSRVVNGVLHEDSAPDPSFARDPTSWAFLRDDHPNLTTFRYESLAFHPRFSVPQRTDLRLTTNATKSHNISQTAIDGVSFFMQGLFADCALWTQCNGSQTEQVPENWTPINGFYFVDHEDKRQYGPPVAKVLWGAANTSLVFEALAASMSNAIRAGGDTNFSTGPGEGNLVQGEVGRLTTRYLVEWRWIVLHCVVNAGGIGFAVWTLVRSWMEGGRVPVWGSHSLAALSRGEVVGGLLAGAESVDEMERRARPVRIRLVDGGERG
ncbi:hypothetical protein B0T16DRAFT_309500, partial [Cercophora newfieldiana]